MLSMFKITFQFSVNLEDVTVNIVMEKPVIIRPTPVIVQLESSFAPKVELKRYTYISDYMSDF
jgi:hypothetical protein